MKIETRTDLSKFFGCFSSFIRSNDPQYIERIQSHNAKKQSYVIEFPVRGDALLQYISAEALSSYIEKRLRLPFKYEKRTFPFPFLLWKEVADDEASSLMTHGCIPITNLPHVFYLNMVKRYDFSKLVFRGEEVISFFGRDVIFGNQESTSLQDIAQQIENTKEIFNALMQRHDELFGLMLEFKPSILSSAEKIENITISNEQLENVINELLTVSKRNGKNDLARVAESVAEMFKKAFEHKKLVEEGKAIEYRIRRKEFLRTLKEKFPTASARSFLTFWGMLADEYKFPGRPEIK